MNLLLLAFTLLAALLAACAPTPTVTITPPPTATPTITPPYVSPPVTEAYDPAKVLAALLPGRPTATSVTLNVVPAVALELFYEYGVASGNYTAQTTLQRAAAATPLETLLTGLQPDTRYYYRLRYGDAAGPEQSFVTARAPGSTFTFDIQSDSHPERLKKQFDPTPYARALQNVAADQPDFYVTLGDDFSVDQLREVNADSVGALYLRQRQWLAAVGAPVFLVNGNHEQAALANLDGTPNNVAVWAQTARNRYFPQPARDAFYSGDTEPVEHIGLLRDYYAFTWGDALFVVIDPYWHSPEAVDNAFGAARDWYPGRATAGSPAPRGCNLNH